MHIMEKVTYMTDVWNAPRINTVAQWNLRVCIVLRGFGFGDVLSMTHKPEHFITGERQRHEHKQSL